MLLKILLLVSKGDEILREAGIEVEFQYNENAAALYRDFLLLKETKFQK